MLPAGSTLCNRPGDKAVHWVPTLSDGGVVIRPTRALAYHLGAGRDPESIEPFPAGPKVVTAAPSGSAGPTCQARLVRQCLNAARACEATGP